MADRVVVRPAPSNACRTEELDARARKVSPAARGATTSPAVDRARARSCIWTLEHDAVGGSSTAPRAARNRSIVLACASCPRVGVSPGGRYEAFRPRWGDLLRVRRRASSRPPAPDRRVLVRRLVFHRAISDRVAPAGITAFRFDFPYSGRRYWDPAGEFAFARPPRSSVKDGELRSCGRLPFFLASHPSIEPSAPTASTRCRSSPARSWSMADGDHGERIPRGRGLIAAPSVATSTPVLAQRTASLLGAPALVALALSAWRCSRRAGEDPWWRARLRTASVRARGGGDTRGHLRALRGRARRPHQRGKRPIRGPSSSGPLLSRRAPRLWLMNTAVAGRALPPDAGNFADTSHHLLHPLSQILPSRDARH